MNKPFLILNQFYQDLFDEVFGDEWRKNINVHTALTIEAIEKELG